MPAPPFADAARAANAANPGTGDAAAALRPQADDLVRLAAKYRTLARLRRERAAGADLPPPATFKVLAREFPGALQELDTLPLDLIDERAIELEAAARALEMADDGAVRDRAVQDGTVVHAAHGGAVQDGTVENAVHGGAVHQGAPRSTPRPPAASPVAPWMEWLFAWHALMRGALLVKASLRGAREVDATRAAELAARASAAARIPFPVALVHGVARPPDGRIARLIGAHAAACFGVTPEALSDATFPAGAGRRRRTKSAPAT